MLYVIQLIQTDMCSMHWQCGSLQKIVIISVEPILIAINSPVLNDDRRPRYMVLIQAITF